MNRVVVDIGSARWTVCVLSFVCTLAGAAPRAGGDVVLVDGVRVAGRRVVANLHTGSNATLQTALAAMRALGFDADGATIR